MYFSSKMYFSCNHDKDIFWMLSHMVKKNSDHWKGMDASITETGLRKIKIKWRMKTWKICLFCKLY